MKTCTISAESIPPTVMRGVTVSNVEVQTEEEGREGEAAAHSLLRLQFDILWSPPTTSNGGLMEYELGLSTEHPVTGTKTLLYRMTFPVSV